MGAHSTPDVDAIRDAEHIVYQAKWRICEELAAERLADTVSLKWTRLFPESPAIQVVAIDGMMVGQVRYTGGRWMATAKGQPGPVADCETFRLALLALACEAEPW